MKKALASMKAPFGFILGGVAVEIARWALGSALNEAHQVYGWRWAEVGAAVFEALKIVGYLAVAIGCLIALALIVREFGAAPEMSGDGEEKPASQKDGQAPTSVDHRPAIGAEISKPETPPQSIKGTSPAYRKAVLQVSGVRSEKQARSGGVVTSATCMMTVTNKVLQALDECSIMVVALRRGNQQVAAGEMLRPGIFRLERSVAKIFVLAHRDRTDLISNPPHLFRTQSADYALEEGATYELELELRSQYPYATKALIELSVPEDPDGAVMGKVISQDVDRTEREMA